MLYLSFGTTTHRMHGTNERHSTELTPPVHFSSTTTFQSHHHLQLQSSVAPSHVHHENAVPPAAFQSLHQYYTRKVIKDRICAGIATPAVLTFFPSSPFLCLHVSCTSRSRSPEYPVLTAIAVCRRIHSSHRACRYPRNLDFPLLILDGADANIHPPSCHYFVSRARRRTRRTHRPTQSRAPGRIRRELYSHCAGNTLPRPILPGRKYTRRRKRQRHWETRGRCCRIVFQGPKRHRSEGSRQGCGIRDGRRVVNANCLSKFWCVENPLVFLCLADVIAQVSFVFATPL